MGYSEHFFKLMAAIYEYMEDEDIENLVKDALDSGVNPMSLIDNGLMPGIKKISESFSARDAFLPELMLSAKAMKTALGILEPEIRKNKQSRKILGKVVLGTVKGDVHDVGKSILKMMMEVEGFEVHDLGIDVSVESFLQAIDEHDPSLVGTGAFLSTTVGEQKKIIEAISSAGMRNRIKYFVGGTAATQEWANKIGADGYADNAIDAVNKMKKSLGVI